MAELIISMTDHYCFIRLLCGASKSMTWLLPITVAMQRRKIETMIVVLPYNFLVCYLEYNAKQLLQSQLNVCIETLIIQKCSEAGH